jgi:hypothetical protein
VAVWPVKTSQETDHWQLKKVQSAISRKFFKFEASLGFFPGFTGFQRV